MNHLRLNRYVCPDCKGYVVTREVGIGVTPMLMTCRATVGCLGMMQSSFYRGVQEGEEPTYEWYQPEKTERDKLDRLMQDHVRAGGLLIRKVEA